MCLTQWESRHNWGSNWYHITNGNSTGMLGYTPPHTFSKSAYPQKSKGTYFFFFFKAIRNIPAGKELASQHLATLGLTGRISLFFCSNLSALQLRIHMQKPWEVYIAMGNAPHALEEKQLRKCAQNTREGAELLWLLKQNLF